MKAGEGADRALIEHMLECIARIREYTKDGHDAFCHSGLIQDAVIRNLQTLAESSQRLSAKTKNKEPTVPWKNMAGMRNILVHDYLGGVDGSMVWEVVVRHLPELEQALNRLPQHTNHN